MYLYQQTRALERCLLFDWQTRSPRSQDRDEIPDQGPDGDGREDEIHDAAEEGGTEDEGDGEDLLDDNMWKCDSPPRACAWFLVVLAQTHSSETSDSFANRRVPGTSDLQTHELVLHWDSWIVPSPVQM
jgi:hypothetical protein